MAADHPISGGTAPTTEPTQVFRMLYLGHSDSQQLGEVIELLNFDIDSLRNTTIFLQSSMLMLKREGHYFI